MTHATRLALVFHAHQPPGNTRVAVQRMVDAAYRPALVTLARFPDIPITLHVSGSLIRWLEQLAPDVLDLIGAMVNQGQVELLAGAFHHPLLPLIPQVDRCGQLAAHRALLAARFGVEPRGVWIPERVWEQTLLPDLVASGARYTVLDDHLFTAAGLQPNDLIGPYLTEDQGETLTVFPAGQHWRYVLPFTAVPQIFEMLQAWGAMVGPGALAVHADDLEKLGGWPGTYEFVHAGGWLAEFLAMLRRERPNIAVETLGTAARQMPPRGFVTLPAGAYPELMRLALPPTARELPFTFGQGRGFLARYPEARIDYRRQQQASRVVHTLSAPAPELLDLLWQGQTDAHGWYGWFAGIYHPRLRHQARAALARAEAGAHAAGTPPAPAHETFDLDLDGDDEVIVRRGRATFAVAPADDGTLVVWEPPDGDRDLVGCMTAWPEAQSSATATTGTRPWRTCRDWWFPATGWLSAQAEPIGRYPIPPLRYSHRWRQGPRDEDELVLSGRLVLPDAAADAPLLVTKTYRFDKHGRAFRLDLSLTNPGSQARQLRHGVALQLALTGIRPEAPTTLSFPDVGVCGLDPATCGEITGVRRAMVTEEGGPSIGVALDRAATFHHFPVETALAVEGQHIVLIQGVGLLALCALTLNPGQTAGWSLAVSAFTDLTE